MLGVLLRVTSIYRAQVTKCEAMLACRARKRRSIRMISVRMTRAWRKGMRAGGRQFRWFEESLVPLAEQKCIRSISICTHSAGRLTLLVISRCSASPRPAWSSLIDCRGSQGCIDLAGVSTSGCMHMHLQRLLHRFSHSDQCGPSRPDQACAREAHRLIRPPICRCHCRQMRFLEMLSPRCRALADPATLSRHSSDANDVAGAQVESSRIESSRKPSAHVRSVHRLTRPARLPDKVSANGIGARGCVQSASRKPCYIFGASQDVRPLR